MNPTLAQLAYQAGITVNAESEKFAELIVRECADIATINQFQWASAGSYVLEHFGVELDINETLRNRSTYFGNDI